MLNPVRFFLSTLLISSLVLAAPSPSNIASLPHVVHDRRAALPVSWKRTSRLSAREASSSAPLILPMRIGLKQRNLHTLLDSLLAVSDPTSHAYGQHWTPQEVVDHFAPSAETIDSVLGWLTDAGLAHERLRVTPSRGWIEVNASVAEVEELLKTEYHVYEHHSGKESIACDSYSVPEHIREHIDIIMPTVHFDAVISKPAGIDDLKKRKRNVDRIRPGDIASGNGPKTAGEAVTLPLTLATCDEAIIPECLQALYNIHYTPVSTHKNTFGIVEFTPQAFLGGDLDLFFANFSPKLVGVRPQLVSIDGGVAQTTDQSFGFNGESDLDLEVAMALTDPQPIILLQTGDLVEGASFNNWLDAVDGSYCTFEGGDDPNEDGIYPDPLGGGFEGHESCGIIKPPNTVSVSYGQDEAGLPAFYAERQCNEYGKLGLLGTSVFYSSGDTGVAGGDGCLGSDGLPSPTGTRFNPSFPGGCPLLTSVGATQINPGATVNEPEMACEQVIFSGGGFSNIFAIADYQKAAVDGFLKNHPPPFTSAQFNNSGTSRAFPDVAANGANYVIGVDGEFELVFGTSCSSPVFASIITLVNDARLAIGKGPVGFINPAIYSKAFSGAFNDITSGGNQGCGTAGFTATTGWDPVTGLGTPNFEKLKELWLALP